MRLFATIRRLARHEGGSAIVEFSLLAPALITMMLAILQFGLAMQQYNALRGVAGDVERYAVVNYQTSNRISTDQLATYTQQVATNSPYNIPTTGLRITVTQPATQRVTGATEYSLAIRAQVTSVLGIIGINDYYINYTRPIFLVS
ncbi:MAG: TadE/TadG family type IV pilus assembly protein [Novosphingobium sp.]